MYLFDENEELFGGELFACDEKIWDKDNLPNIFEERIFFVN